LYSLNLVQGPKKGGFLHLMGPQALEW